MRLGLRELVVSACALGAIGCIGCGPAVSDEELGRVVAKVPEIPEGYKPYELPSLVAPETAGPPEEPQGE